LDHRTLTFRTDDCLIATAYPRGNRRERAERPIFDAGREHLRCRESYSPHYAAKERREAVLTRGPPGVLILMEDIVELG
jgi:hypothetical protein